MSQGVTYADLRFVRTPPEKSQEKDPSEGELTYENIQRPMPQEERTPTTTEDPKEPDRRTWFATLALLATCLLLLAIAIGLGVRYWQASRQLQQANEEGSILEWRIGSKEDSLNEAQAELHSTNGTLWGCWAAGNRTQEQLRQANQTLTLMQREKETLQQEKQQLQRDKAELQQEKQQLQRDKAELQQEKQQLQRDKAELQQEKQQLQRDKAELQQEKQQLQRDKAELQEENETFQQQLEEMRRNLELVVTCQQKEDYIPNRWNLVGWRCLWISSSKETKNWEESKEACRAKSSQLLVLKSRSAEELFVAAFTDKRNSYWIGLKKHRQYWKWVDGTIDTRTEKPSNCQWTYYDECMQMSQGALQKQCCQTKNRYICEKEARPLQLT